jgi:hypothetical protein
MTCAHPTQLIILLIYRSYSHCSKIPITSEEARCALAMYVESRRRGESRLQNEPRFHSLSFLRRAERELPLLSDKDLAQITSR